MYKFGHCKHFLAFLWKNLQDITKSSEFYQIYVQYFVIVTKKSYIGKKWLRTSWVHLQYNKERSYPAKRSRENSRRRASFQWNWWALNAKAQNGIFKKPGTNLAMNVWPDAISWSLMLRIWKGLRPERKKTLQSNTFPKPALVYAHS